MRILSVIICLVFSSIGPLLFAQDPTSLNLGYKAKHSISSGEEHKYHLESPDDQFILLLVDQQGVDLDVTVTGPDGEQIGIFDSPNGLHGLEIVSIKTEQAGTYEFIVAPLDQDGDGQGELGDYTIELLKFEEVAKSIEARIDQTFAAYDRPGVPGATVAVMYEGEVIYSKGFGEANLEYSVPNGPETVFHVASVSKQFTAFSIAMLAQQGKLSLDDDIREYLPEMHAFDQPITIRHLIHHTSGLRDQWNLLVMAGWRFDDVITIEQIEKLLVHQRELNFMPGEEYFYCNSGYFLMARIVEKVTDQTFAAWTKENIFEPLGMDHTLVYNDHEVLVPNRAYSYYSAPDGYKKRVLSYANDGATSLFTTAEDLCKWAANFHDVKVGTQQLIDQMYERGILNNGDTISYAFGQVIAEYKGMLAANHGGADAGFRTFLGRVPEKNAAVVVLSNLASFDPGGYAIQVADIVMEDIPEPADTESADTESTNDEDSTESSEEDHIVSNAILDEYIGRYELTPQMTLEVTIDDGTLFLQATNQQRLPSIAQSDTEFFFPDATGTATIEFERTDDGDIKGMILKQGGGEYPAPRLPEFDHETVDLAKYEGTYHSPELMTELTLVLTDGKLVASHARQPDFELELVKPNTFNGSVWYYGTVEMVEDNGAITGFKVSNGRVRNLNFNRVN